MQFLLILSLTAGWFGSERMPMPIEDRGSLKRLNRRLQGRVVDFTRNHRRDNRIDSEILQTRRDLYVYLPPGYDPARSYSLILWFHGAFGDEHAFLTECQLCYLDKLIARGCFPPVIVACPDGTFCGTNRFTEQHSFYVNGIGGRYEDHVMLEVLPFLLANFSIRPEREAHAIAGISAGGFGALSLAMRRRDYFSKVTVLAGPVNLRYYTIRGKYFGEFKPRTYAWRTVYNPREVVGKYFGLLRLRAERLIGAVFGPEDELLANVEAVNPADLLLKLDIQPGELEIYLNFPSHDNFNFDAQAESFAWLARQRGLEVELRQDRLAQHLVPYFHENHKRALDWLCPRLLPPTDLAVPPESAATPPAPLAETVTPKFR